MIYARAGFLLDWSGGPSALIFDPGATDPWHEAWTADLGSPLAANVAVGAGWRRTYTGGIIALNRSRTTRTIPLAGTYLAADGTPASSVTLASDTAAILRTAPTRPTPTLAPTAAS